LVPAWTEYGLFSGKSCGILFWDYAWNKGAAIRGILKGSYTVPYYSVFKGNKAYSSILLKVEYWIRILTHGGSQDTHPKDGGTTEQRGASGESGYSSKRDIAEEWMTQDTHPRDEGKAEQRGYSGYSIRGGDTAEMRVSQDIHPEAELKLWLYQRYSLRG
jgi:hypothetical protein